MAKKTVTLIDGSGFIFRAYHALPPLTRPDGTPVGAVLGFCNMLLKFLGDPVLSKCVAVIFDAGRETFRQTIYPEYKAHRPPPPEDLIPQFPLFREACRAFNLPVIERAGFEADDVIATYARQAKEKGLEVVVISADKDLMQLVDDHLIMIDPLKNKKISYIEVEEKFGVHPSKVIEVQALIGDSSDNVPGVPSIGPKTAAELIGQFQTLENIYDNLDLIKQPKRRQALLENRDKAFLSKKLVTLKTDVPLENSIESFDDYHMTKEKLIEFFKEQNFSKLVSRLSASNESIKQESNYVTFSTPDQLKEWLKDVTELLALDCETTSLNVIDAEIVGIALSKGEGKAGYIPLGHVLNGEIPFDNTHSEQMNITTVKEILVPYLAHPSIMKVGHNLKYDRRILEKYGISFSPFDDTLVMSYSLDGGKHRHGLDFLAKHYFTHTMISYNDVTGVGKKQINFSEVSIPKATTYAAEDADFTLRLYKLLRPRIFFEKSTYLYTSIEKPLVDILARMENRGIIVNAEVLKEIGEDFKKRSDLLESEIYFLAGCTFNIASSKQLGEILFQMLKLPEPKKTKTGTFSTDSDILEDLAYQGFEIAQKLIDWRSLTKLRSTYIDGLQDAISKKTGRVHTSYNLAGTTTGRLSSSDPNLQNIPIRTEDGRRIRKAFEASKGFKLVSFDYSQIELRLLAHMAGISSLQHAFCEGQDIHKLTASQIFHTPIEQVTADQRRSAKAINFGIIYGISAFGLGKQLKMPQTDAQKVISAYLKQYPGIESYMEDMKAFAREKGFVTTIMGRRCHTPGILDKNYTIRGFSERQAINAPLQGSNADIIKKAMIHIDQKFRKDPHVHMLLQIHDELIFEISDDYIQETKSLIKKIMESVVRLSVPLTVDVAIGHTWDEI